MPNVALLWEYKMVLMQLTELCPVDLLLRGEVIAYELAKLGERYLPYS